ncbi:MAG: CDP-diacylglycerol--glycerol-3-phosphate 3-phosphatidyltransferase [Gemmatimonadota bacterium]|jgi:CDP-diacylglycerol--glycerol-3-phosphate 3-phosphatidyltransferase|nr:CDP-diacylglycerol--glycerol-3-phosphate 3-phosphatidyltransferase [Gemmatimonadota bacterium]
MTISNQLTLLRLVLSPVFVVLLLRQTAPSLWLALLVFTVAALTDAWDGHLARRHGWISRTGRILDPIADKVLVGVAYVSFLAIGLPSMKSWMVAIILGREVAVTLLRVLAGRRGVTIESSRLGKWKTISQMTLVFVLLALMSARALVDPSPAYWKSPGIAPVGTLLLAALVLATAVTFGSGADYFWRNRRVFSPSRPSR